MCRPQSALDAEDGARADAEEAAETHSLHMDAVRGPDTRLSEAEDAAAADRRQKAAKRREAENLRLADALRSLYPAASTYAYSYGAAGAAATLA